jgi:hypothetical protein
VISYVAFGGDEKAMKAFLAERKQVVKEFVIRAIVMSGE